MAESNDTNQENGNSTEAIQVSVGAAQRMSAQDAGPAAAAAPASVAALSAADLDARQQAIGTTRRSGPPMTDDGVGAPAAAAAAASAAVEQVEATEVSEPRK